MKLGERLRLRREKLGFSLRDLEKKSGISNTLLSMIETGHVRNPSWWNIVILARILGISLKVLASCQPEDKAANKEN